MIEYQIVKKKMDIHGSPKLQYSLKLLHCFSFLLSFDKPLVENKMILKAFGQILNLVSKSLVLLRPWPLSFEVIFVLSTCT